MIISNSQVSVSLGRPSFGDATSRCFVFLGGKIKRVFDIVSYCKTTLFIGNLGRLQCH